MSIVDLVAFFAIAPTHKKTISEAKDLELLQTWLNKMEESDDLVASLQELNLAQPEAVAPAKTKQVKL